MSEALEQIESLEREARAALGEVGDAEALERFRIRYLGTKGAVRGLMKLLGEVPKDQKPAVGQRVNRVKESITERFERKKGELEQAADADGMGLVEDVTEPGRRPEIGGRHILMKVQNELTELFGRMGFSVAEGPEVEDEFHNFVALNIPESHPARDPLDNFYLAGSDGATKGSGSGDCPRPRRSDEGGEREGSGFGVQGSAASRTPNPVYLLRTQTSTVQIRVMQKQKPPIRVVMPGRVYRPDTHDATHLHMFHQLEALVVDKGVSMVDLKSTVLQFIHAYLGPETQVRFRPSFFPFTEPSAEVDVWFPSKEKWIEMGGCGMVHPNVFQACGIDPEIYTGWAFGFGFDRIAMRKYGIDDIRLFVENDVRFLRQF